MLFGKVPDDTTLKGAPVSSLKVPEDIQDLDRAVMLLGSRTKGDLTPKTRKELIALIGSYPAEKRAAEWKLTLKRLRREWMKG